MLGALAVAVPAALPSPATAADPQWFEGAWGQQTGINCTILGHPYTEPMTQFRVGYRGLPDGSEPYAGERYWGRVYVGVTGNTCPKGWADFVTEVNLPRGTSLAMKPGSSDLADRIRCWLSIHGGPWQDVTDQQWTLPGGVGSGRFCSSTDVRQGAHGGFDLGQNVLAQGMQFQVIFPLVSATPLSGLATNDELVATLTSGVNSTGTATGWVYVAPAPSGGTGSGTGGTTGAGTGGTTGGGTGGTTGAGTGGTTGGGTGGTTGGAPDSDGDGVPNASDRCPHEAGPASSGGCPVQQPSPVATIGIAGRQSLRALIRGLRPRIVCSQSATAAVALVVDAKTAYTLPLGPGARIPLTIAHAGATCGPRRPVTVTLKPARDVRGKLRRVRRAWRATLQVAVTSTGGRQSVVSRRLQIGT